MSKQGKKIEDIDQLLAMAGSNLSILEEEVDIKVQKEYFEMVNLLSKRTENYQKTSKQYLENINDLYDDTIDPEIKKKMLVVWQLWTMFRYTVLSKIFRNKTLP